MAGAPGIPQNLIIQSANRQILVSWDLSSGATSYTIQRSLDNVTYTPLATVTGSPLATSYVDTAVVANTEYWYRVAASTTIGSVNFIGQPNPGDTVTIDNVVFTAVTAGPVGTQFAIGAAFAATITNLSQVINNTIPGIVAASATDTQLLLSSYSSAIPALSSALTNTTVTSFTTGGTSSYTSPVSAIPVPTGEMALAQIRLKAQQRADRVNSSFVTTSEWNSYINQAMFELYDLLVTEYEDYFIAPIPAQFTVNGSQFLYPLPDGLLTFNNGLDISQAPFIAPPFYKLSGVDLALNNATNGYVTLNRFNFINRNQFVYPNTASTIYGVFNMQYRIMGNNLEFIPTPSAGQQIRLWYIPRLQELLLDTDTTTIGISGWIEYVIVRAAYYALTKEESDTMPLVQQLEFVKDRIESAASNRDAGRPDTISDSRSTSSNGYGNGFGGGWNGSSGGF